MIIVLKGADFSAKNIGKVNLRVNLTEKTKNVFSKMTRFDATSEEAWAFDDFYNTLNATGIWEKINKLHLPVLANTKDEAFYDIVGEGGYDITGISDDYILFNDDGSTSVGNQTVTANPANVKYTLETPVNYNNCTAIMFTVEGLIEAKLNGVDSVLSSSREMSTYLHLGVPLTISAGGGDSSFLGAITPADGYPMPNSHVNGLLVKNSGFFAATHTDKNDISGGKMCAFYSHNNKALANLDFVAATKPNSDGISDTICLYTQKWQDGTNAKGYVIQKTHTACFCITKEALTDHETWVFNDALDDLMTALGFSGKFKARKEFV